MVKNFKCCYGIQNRRQNAIYLRSNVITYPLPPAPFLTVHFSFTQASPNPARYRLSIIRLLRPNTLHLLINMPPTVQLMPNLLQPFHNLIPCPFRITELGKQKQGEAFQTGLIGVHSDAASVFVDWVFGPGTEGDFVVPGVLLVSFKLHLYSGWTSNWTYFS